MPYISESDRDILNKHIDDLSSAIFSTKLDNNPHDFSQFLGAINYCFSRVLMRVMRSVSYSKIAMATGVLENIKQEFYSRIARSYEDQKIVENGDIYEYKVWSK